MFLLLFTGEKVIPSIRVNISLKSPDISPRGQEGLYAPQRRAISKSS
jgi:hypothetical protein